MGRASQALKQVLETYTISQNKLAVTMNRVVCQANFAGW
jgi:hypothetical protein